ncbi:GlsB/YeaQ/YmgE family stress response membrane protein [Hansschlegelia plantiphila]|uniref:Membrane protein n=1 Tax=Hansschlegelia plantiphila TaxID=374655 RepID=A0A9W6J1C1_9HYPH|nr:GlsB/YeaQ/YmgE family stress response membrane protein [Hansschlegelia plantiphila]GLK67484.1 membrane protein [Hansschlegelia plantiphila]
MTGVGWFMAIVLGGIAGWIAEQLMKSDMGVIMNIVLGIVGAIVMNAILGAIGIPASGGWIIQCLVAVVGACLLIFLYRMIRGRTA